MARVNGMVVINEETLLYLLREVRRAQGKLHQVKNGQQLIYDIDYAIYTIGNEANEFQPELVEEFVRKVRLDEDPR